MFDARIKTAPVRIDEDSEGDLSESVPSRFSNFATLLTNATSCSPFLKSIAQGRTEWVVSLAEREPEEVFEELVCPGPLIPPANTARRLRRSKRRMAFLVAMADLGGVWDHDRVVTSITRFADFAVGECLRALVAASIPKGKRADPLERLTENCLDGLFVLAMGKMGAFELNYSSDIDLILLFDDSRYADSELAAVRGRFVRITRRFVSLMSNPAEDGYIFRTDLRLRPDPLVTPVCLSAGAAERYYENFGRTWERSAFIKARPCAGDVGAAERFLRSIQPFIWRKNLDYASVEDARNMRQMINRKVDQETGDGGLNVKLGRGGIRDIEMMTQALQIIAGGRDPELRVRGTIAGLERLRCRRLVDGDVYEVLTRRYVDLRRIEHRLQMVNDSQTHSLPGSATELRRVAALCGWNDPSEFASSVEMLMGDVDRITREFFAPAHHENGNQQGGGGAEVDHAAIERWQRMAVLRNDRASAVFSRIQPKIMTGLQRAKNVEQAAAEFEGFLRGLPAGVQLFSLFESNPVLVDLLTDICSTAPGLASHLSRNSSVFDAVLDGDFFDEIGPPEHLTIELDEVCSPVNDFETLLDAIRRWKKERHFQVGVQHLRGLVDWAQAAESYADIAEAVLNCIWPRVIRHFSERHGSPPGNGAVVVGMGSLGARMLTAQSDLDLILVFDCEDDTISSGRIPLPVRQYYARLTQALISALSSRTAEGNLYSIDMRLRPSGRKGPVATSLAAFEHYQHRNAWTWEHMALTKARPIVGPDTIMAGFEQIRNSVIAMERRFDSVVNALRSMRKRLSENIDQSRNRDLWEVRLGEGRILDIELTVQAGALLAGELSRSHSTQLSAVEAAGMLSRQEADALGRSHVMLRQILQVARLTVEHAFSPDTAGEGAVSFLLRQTEQSSIADLETMLRSQREDCMLAIGSFLNRNVGGEH